jgi:hypothetical protein
MGTWGFGSFENDGASDWAYDLASTGVALLHDTLQEVLANGEDCVEAGPAENAVAAAEVVATLGGKSGKELPDSVAEWVRSHRQDLTPFLREMALSALERVQRPPSELLELWEESPEFAQWQEAMNDLRQRLKS